MTSKASVVVETDSLIGVPALLPTLTETTTSTLETVVVEGVAGKTGKVIMKGHFGNYDVPTLNKRLYPKTLWEKEITRLEKTMQERQMYGCMDHPESGRTSLNNVSHLVTKLWLEDGRVMGEAEVLDTESGRNLKELLKAGCKLGVSSRGYGSTKPDSAGNDVVGTDYRLVTYDVVAEPAAGAFPAVFFEWKGQKLDTKNVTPAILKEAAPDLVKAISEAAVAGKEEELATLWTAKIASAEEAAKSSLREELSRELLAQIVRAKKDLREEIAVELTADPKIAGARLALESIKAAVLPFMLAEEQVAYIKTVEESAAVKVAALDKALAETSLKLVAAEDNVVQIESTLREVGYKLFVEQILDGNAEGRSMVGDLKQYPSATEIKAKAEEVKAALEARRIKAESEQTAKPKVESVQGAAALTEVAELRKELTVAVGRASRAESQIESFETKFSKTQSIVEAYEIKLNATEAALEKATEAQEALQVQLYAERKLTNNPKAGKIRSVLESGNGISSKEQVDHVVEEFREPIRDSEDLAAVRARVRAQTRGGRSSTALEEETAPKKVTGGAIDFAELGISAKDFKTLAGNKRK